jgi:hypothetical protein
MSLLPIEVGLLPNDGMGDKLRAAFQKINTNFSAFAAVAFTGSYSSLSGTPALSSVATSGDYNDLLDLPTLGALAYVSTIDDTYWSSGGNPLSIAHGGTGQTNLANSFNALVPFTAPGDMLYESAAGLATALPIGSEGQQLRVVSGMPQWQAPINAVTPYNSLQYNANGSFAGAGALLYSPTSNHLTITSATATSTPLNIVASGGQTGDLLDLSNTVSQGSLAKFTANGSLYIQGAAGAATSVEIGSATVAARTFDCKLSSGASGPYFRAIDDSHIGVYASNGDAVGSLGWGEWLKIFADAAGKCHLRNGTQAHTFKCFNTYVSDSNFECGGFDWQANPNVLRCGTEKAGAGVARNLHFMTGGVECLRIDAFQNIVCGNGALTTSSTDGHFHVPSVAGAPSGIPTNFNNMCPIVIDRTNFYIYVRVGGAWKKTAQLT